MAETPKPLKERLRKPTTKSNRKLDPKTGKVAKKAKKPIQNCVFCGVGLTSDYHLLRHVCEAKRRFIRRDDKPVKMGLISYQRFAKRSLNRLDPPSYEQFAQSTLYNAFVHFGQYLLQIQAINALGFVDFLIKVEAPINRWEHPVLYERYVRELCKAEDPLDALERQILLMQGWSMDTGDEWTDFFRRVAPGQAVTWIQSGRLSPWVIFTAPSVADLMARLSVEQARIIETCIDASFWSIKLQRHAEAVQHIKSTLLAAGL